MSDRISQLVLLTGATGYVGGRLLPLLVGQGARVRCLARQPERLQTRVPAGVEVVRGDVLDAASLAEAMAGVERALYLVHSMGAAGDFAEADRRAAQKFGATARAAGVSAIVYLGEQAPELSPHLRSRHEVGDVLRASGVPVIELRASVIIGSGSLSFEMIRALVERLPVMVTPRWVRVPAQPIFIGDVLAYSGGGGGPPDEREPDVRDRRPGRRLVWRTDARVCAALKTKLANWLTNSGEFHLG